MSNVIAFSHTREHLDKPAAELSVSREIILNKLCCSLITKENQRRFRAFPESYCREYGLILEQIHAVTDLDILRLLNLGATIANLQILTATYGIDVIELCAEQTGKSVAEVKGFIGKHYTIHKLS